MSPETATDEQSVSVRAVPPNRQALSASQVRVLLNALMRTPAGVVQQVGFLLMLFVALAEAPLVASSAPPRTALISGRAASTAVHGHKGVTTDEREWSAKLIAFAKVKREKGGQLIGKAGTDKIRPKCVRNVKVETLRRWAVRQHKKVQPLLRLLEASTDIGIENALLVKYHAEGIVAHDASKVNEKNLPSVSHGPRQCHSVDESPYGKYLIRTKHAFVACEL